MEPNFLADFARSLVQIYGIPLVAFAFGVILCDRLHLHAVRRRGDLFLVAVPVAFVSLALMIASHRIEGAVAGDAWLRYAHMQSTGKYILFNIIVVFFGTVVPQTFFDIGKRVSKHKKDAVT